MSAILDLDQIACSGNGVVSDKWVSPALTHLTGSLQQRVLVQIGNRGWGGGVLCILLKDSLIAAGSAKGKAGRGSFLAHLSPPAAGGWGLEAFCLRSAASVGWTFVKCLCAGHTACTA